MGWLLAVAGARPLKTPTKQAIRDIVDRRNGFVHYKWREAADRQDAELRRALRRAERCVQALRAFGNRYLFDGQRSQIHRALALKPWDEIADAWNLLESRYPPDGAGS